MSRKWPILCQSISWNVRLVETLQYCWQTLPVPKDTIQLVLGPDGSFVSASPVITVEPRRRRFHAPVNLTMPAPESSIGRKGKATKDDSKLRLLYSVTGKWVLICWLLTEVLAVWNKQTSASAGLQDANPTIRPYARPYGGIWLSVGLGGAVGIGVPPIPTAPPSLAGSCHLHPVSGRIHPGSNAAAVTPREPKFTKMGEAHRG